MNPTRRDILALMLSTLGASFVGCSMPESFSRRRRLVDLHMHAFNATDLPVRRFLRIVVMHDYPKQGVEALVDLNDEDVVDWLIELFVAVISGRATTARAELAQLSSGTMPPATDADTETIARVAGFLPVLFSPDAAGFGAFSTEGANQLRSALLRAGGVDPAGFTVFDESVAQRIARQAYFSIFDIGTLLRWFTLFTLDRGALLARLTTNQRTRGYEPVLLSPALIDYSRWLGETVDSPLSDQVAVLGQLSRHAAATRDAPLVHGYIAFDPLRQVYFRRGKEAEEPLAVVREALTEHGFLGVKLYPPMGFRASNNVSPYPQDIIDEIGELSSGLDEALAELWTLAKELGAPILTHTANSNGAGPEYAERADPYYWLPVLREYRELPVCFAHFGRFGTVSKGALTGTELPDSSWEWTIGRQLIQHPDAPILVDLSYFSEILEHDNKHRNAIAQAMRRFIAEFDQGVRHIAFGTDWIMLAKEREHSRYTEAVEDFLRNDCSLDDAALDRVFFGNAIRKVGLVQSGKARLRLEDWYQRNGINPERLRVLDT